MKSRRKIQKCCYQEFVFKFAFDIIELDDTNFQTRIAKRHETLSFADEHEYFCDLLHIYKTIYK